MSRAVTVVTFVTALGSALVSGVFFAFSTFVMKALARLPAAQGIAAMQSINVVAINRWFMGALVGTAVACAALAIASIVGWSAAGARFRLAGSLVYIAGTIVVTRAFNIPRNDALAAVSPDTVVAARLWTDYLATWTQWNHVRTIAPLVAAALLMGSLLVEAGR